MIENILKKIFPDIVIPKPIYFDYHHWENATYSPKEKYDYCEYYPKIIFPFKNKPIYITGESYSERIGWMNGALEKCNEIIQKINSSGIPTYSPGKWNNNLHTRKSHNCYAYFLNKYSNKISRKCKKRNSRKCKMPQPGYYSGYTKITT